MDFYKNGCNLPFPGTFAAQYCKIYICTSIMPGALWHNYQTTKLNVRIRFQLHRRDDKLRQREKTSQKALLQWAQSNFNLQKQLNTACLFHSKHRPQPPFPCLRSIKKCRAARGEKHEVEPALLQWVTNSFDSQVSMNGCTIKSKAHFRKSTTSVSQRQRVTVSSFQRVREIP